MMGQEQAAAAFANATEAWAIYDAAQIRSDIEQDKLGYKSYQAMGALDEWPFFDQRKSDVGIAYTNRDSNETLEYVFHAYSLGVRFVPAPCLVEPPADGGGADNHLVHQVLNQALLEHVGLIVRVQQDDKLIHQATLAPDGAGPFGVSVGVAGGVAPFAGVGAYCSTNGEPLLANRWKWPDPVSIPRGATFSVRLRPSKYLKALMTAMPGPGDYDFHNGTVKTTVPACALMRVDLIGKREVMQRNQLHR